MEVAPLLLPDVKEALQRDPSSVSALIGELHPEDLADLVEQLEQSEAYALVNALRVEDAADVVSSLETDRAVELFEELATREPAAAGALADAMPPDDRADLIGEMTAATRRAVLGQMEDEEERDVRELLSHEEGTAGALMTTNFVVLNVDMTAAEGIHSIRQHAEEMETIYDVYIVDAAGTLVGALSLRDLMLAKNVRKLSELMEPNVISVSVDDAQEEVTRLMQRYDLLALPVIDRTRKIIGIITFDDAMDVIQEEAQEDVQRLGAMEPIENAYFATGFWEFVWKRGIWLVVLFLAGFVTASAMKHITASFDRFAPLLWFIPLIIAAGGNAGSQSASLMIRSLALGDVQPRDFFRVIGREVGMGFALGVPLALLGAVRALIWEVTRVPGVIATVCLTIVAVVTVGAVIGSGLPLMLQRLGLDPATSSTPFIASLSDVIGLVAYVLIANAIMF